MSEQPPNTIEVAPGLYLPEAVLDFSFARSGGPGGQNVNKLNTKAVLSVALDDLALVLPPPAIERLEQLAGSSVTIDRRLMLACDEHRSQVANRKTCIEKLRDLINRARVRPKRRKKTRPSKASKERRLTAKKQRGETKKRRSEF